MHEIVRANHRQSLSHPTKSGKRATWNELYPERLIDELWQLIECVDVSGCFVLQRADGRPRRGKNGCVGVRFQNADPFSRTIAFTFQPEQKGAQTRYVLGVPSHEHRSGSLNVLMLQKRFAALDGQRDRKGNLDLLANRCSGGLDGDQRQQAS